MPSSQLRKRQSIHLWRRQLHSWLVTFILYQNHHQSYQNSQSNLNSPSGFKTWCCRYWRRTIFPRHHRNRRKTGQLRGCCHHCCLRWNFPKKTFWEYSQSCSNGWNSHKTFGSLHWLWKRGSFYSKDHRFSGNWADWWIGSV